MLISLLHCFSLPDCLCSGYCYRTNSGALFAGKTILEKLTGCFFLCTRRIGGISLFHEKEVFHGKENCAKNNKKMSKGRKNAPRTEIRKMKVNIGVWSEKLVQLSIGKTQLDLPTISYKLIAAPLQFSIDKNSACSTGNFMQIHHMHYQIQQNSACRRNLYLVSQVVRYLTQRRLFSQYKDICFTQTRHFDANVID